MEPATVLGVVAASLQIAQFIGKTIQGLNTLKGKYNDADTTIRLLISQLSTIKNSILQIRDWAEYNFDDSPKERRFLDGLNVALDGCQAAMDVLSEEVKDLMDSVESATSGGLTALGMRDRARVVWNEPSMKAHQDRLSGQVQALQLLLIAGQCRDAVSQSNLLGLKENRKLLQRVAEDTKSLRESHSSAASQITRSVRQSTVSGTVFDFDPGLAETDLYRAATGVTVRRNTTPVRTITRKPVGSASRNDEGYETATPHSAPQSPRLSRNPSTSSTSEDHPLPNQRDIFPDLYNPNILRRPSIADSSAVSEPAIHRWLSTSSSADSPPGGDKITDLGKKKTWQKVTRLARLNTFSASKISSQAQRTQSAGASSGSGQRWKRHRETNTKQSIDFTSPDGLETPTLVRVAQAGNRVEIERLIENGDDIEGRHTATQRTALAVAAHCGLADIVDILIQRNARLDTRDHDLSTPLHLAASRGHRKVMASLLNEDVDIEATNKNYQTPLWVAVDNGHLKAVEMLLKRGAKINSRANDQLTALHMAAKEGDREMIELLLRHNAHIEARDSNSMAAIHYACEGGHHVAVEFLLQKGANIEASGKNSMSPLICAAASGSSQVVELLTRKKASPRSLDEKKANALHWAASNGHVEIAEHLIAWKISVHDTDMNGLTPLHVAVIGSHFAVVDFLLRKNASVESACKEGWTPMHYACSSYNSDIVRLLLSAGAKHEAQVPGDGKRPIHIAAANGTVEIVDFLHQKGADISVRDAAGDRPICIASRNGHVEVVQKLLDYGEPLRLAFKNRPNEDSPLCIAAGAGHLDVVRLLIRRGASVKQRDECGFIPLRYAAFYGHPEVLRLLLDEGAEILDDGEDSSGWGFLLMPDMIGFCDASNISNDRKDRVRELLEEAERRMNGQINAGTSRRTDPGSGGMKHVLARAASRRELAGSNYLDSLSGTHIRPPPPSYDELPAQYPTTEKQEMQQPQQPQQSYHLPSQYGTTEARNYYAPVHSPMNRYSAVTTYPSPAYPSNGASYTPYAPSPYGSTNPAPEEAAERISSIQAEIAHLEQFIPRYGRSATQFDLQASMESNNHQMTTLPNISELDGGWQGSEMRSN